MKKTELLDFYCEMCRKSGSIMEVGPERYEAMAEIPDDEMEDLLVDLAHANAESLERIAKGKENHTPSDQDFIDFMEMMLNLIFLGYVAINPEGGLGCFAPEGPPPTEEEELAMDRRIRSAFPIIRRAIIRASGGGNHAER